MASLRLHMIVPLAVLGLLGAAVGVFMVGKKPPDSDAGVPIITTHPEKKKVTKAVWATKADAWCADTASRLQPPKGEPTPEEFESWFGAAVEALDSAEPSFEELRWPRGEKATVMRLRGDFKQWIRVFRATFNRYQAGRFENALSTLERLRGSDWNEEMRRLGAKVCAASQEKAAKALTRRVAVKPAAELIRAQLVRYPKVVVLFYNPGASYDGIQTREARAGALLAHAGFVAVDVSKNREVAQLAAGYDVLESPTVLIFARPLKLKARIVGFYDRTAVLQAVRNA